MRGKLFLLLLLVALPWSRAARFDFLDADDQMEAEWNYIDDQNYNQNTFGEFFHFEDGKALLFAIKSNIGHEALKTFETKGNNEIPDDGHLPALYRSDHLDNLGHDISQSGYKYIVAEMRKHGHVVAQVVFNVSTNPSSLNMKNWFTSKRIVSSFPYHLGKNGFNYFSIDGYKLYKRNFFINTRYGGCPIDTGFWVVISKQDPCAWGSKGWTGSAPLLLYTKVPGVPYEKNNIFQADRFLIYLTNTIPRPHPVESNVFRFEGNKVLLYTIKSKIGQEALKTFETKGNNKIPADRRLPALYRSDQLDRLGHEISRAGYKYIVAEMRKHGHVVAQVVFNVSTNPSSLNMKNWFTPKQIVSSFPYHLGKNGFNYFSIDGYKLYKRNFFINTRYGGCPIDTGFWVVISKQDPCAWGSKGWTGSAPLLLYTKVPGVPYEKNNIFQADRFLIYLTSELPHH